MTNNYNWTDNPTVAGVSVYDPDVLNDCLMHLKYDASANFAEELTNYAKKDFSNLTADAISASAGFSFPSGSHVDLSLGPTGSIYSAPADGWFFLWKNISANGQFAALEVLSGDSVVLQVANSVSVTSWNGFIPCKKGDKIRVQYNLGGTTVLFRFIYAVGNAPQSTESED